MHFIEIEDYLAFALHICIVLFFLCFFTIFCFCDQYVLWFIRWLVKKHVYWVCGCSVMSFFSSVKEALYLRTSPIPFLLHAANILFHKEVKDLLSIILQAVDICSYAPKVSHELR